MATTYLTGCASEQVKQLKNNETILKDQLQLDSNNSIALSKLGALYNDSFKSTGKLHHRDLAITTYKQFTSLHPKHLKEKILLYSLLASQASTHPGSTAMQDLTDLYNNNAILKEVVVSPPGYISALILINKKTKKIDYELPKQKLKLAIKESPKHIDSKLLLSKIYIHENKIALALILLQNVMKINPDHVGALELLALLYSDKSDNEICTNQDLPYTHRLIKILRKLLKATPYDAELHSSQAKFYQRIGKIRLAEFEAKKAMDLSKNTEHKLLYSKVLMAHLKPEKALDGINKILKEEPENDEALLQASFIYLNQGDWKNAEKYWLSHKKQNTDFYFYGYARQFATHSNLYDETRAISYLRKNLTNHDLNNWQTQISMYLLNEISSEKLLTQAKNLCEKTEAEYFIGIKLEASGESNQALVHYENVVDINIPAYLEHTSAHYGILRLKKFAQEKNR